MNQIYIVVIYYLIETNVIVIVEYCFVLKNESNFFFRNIVFEIIFQDIHNFVVIFYRNDRITIITIVLIFEF